VVSTEKSGEPELDELMKEIEAELQEYCKAIRPASRQRFDFFPELQGMDVRVTLYNEKTISGRVLEVRRYWFAITPDGGSTVYYVNKAWVVSVQPLKMRSK
jgi:hypothetical protein